MRISQWLSHLMTSKKKYTIRKQCSEAGILSAPTGRFVGRTHIDWVGAEFTKLSHPGHRYQTLLAETS